MLVRTKYFGDLDLDESKIITFKHGLFGFEEYKKFTLLYDNEVDEPPAISWLQSCDEISLALPVMNPLIVEPSYNPIVSEETIGDLGEFTEKNTMLLVTVTIPSDIKQMTVNLKAPFIIHTDTRQAAQVVVDNPEYKIKHAIYDCLQKMNKKEGELC